MPTLRRFTKRSPMPCTASEVFAWHARPGAFERLAPPWERARVIDRSGSGIDEGTRLTIGIPVGPFTMRWVARHGPVVPGSEFVDEQESGPFRRWRHVHRFAPSDVDASVLEDGIEYALPFGPLGALGARAVERRLDRMFAYRHAVTRADLERHAAYPGGKLTVAVSGATGLVGSALCAFLTTGGHDVRRIVRSRPAPGDVLWNPNGGKIDAKALDGVDAIVHLAGENIAAGRWTDERKRRILASRVDGTQLLARTLGTLAKPPRVFVSASAVGYYGSGADAVDERSPAGGGFLAEVCRAWEDAAAGAVRPGCRVVTMRLGVVVTARGGALAKMLPAFLAGGGGPIGGGAQIMSWVALDDVLDAIHRALVTSDLDGPVNVVSPHPVSQREFAATLGRVLRRPALAPLPAFVVGALFGDMGRETLLAGRPVAPRRLVEAGQRFRHPDLEDALRYELGRSV